LEDIAAQTGRTVPQIALNWLTRRPTVASVIIGARNEAQLRENLGAVGWWLTDEQMQILDTASAAQSAYPHSLYRRVPFSHLNPSLL
jgi:aryl-alcohol dehydrogenase-like predicted oxidoreductase